MEAHSADAATATTAEVTPLGRFLVALSDTVDRGTTLLAVCGTVGFAGIMLLGVFFRYGLNASLSWSDEVALIVFGWVAFLFIASAYLHDKHVNVDILVRNLTGRAKARAEIAAEGLAAGFLLTLLVSSIQAMDVMASGHSDVLRIPVAFHYIIIPFAVAVMLLHWARRNLAHGLGRDAIAKLLVGLLFFAVVYAPVGRFVDLPGAIRVLLLTVALFGPMLIGVPVALTLGVMASLYVALVGDIPFMTAGIQAFQGISIFALLAIPLLILSGKLMYLAGIARLLVNFAQVLVGRVRGGLGASNVVASFIFGDISGSSVSDTAAIGSIMIPQMKERGYRADFCAALQGTAGTLGMTAPLSITVLLYAAAVNTSVSRLAAATIVPSILLAASFIGVVMWHARKHNYPRETMPRHLILPHTVRALPGISALVLVVGGILGGVFTPAEVGTILLVYILCLTVFLYRAARPGQLYDACVEAGHITGMTLFMVCTSSFVGFVFARDLVAIHFLDIVAQISMNPYFVIFILSVAFIVLGMFLEPPAMIFGFLPTMMPLLAQAKIDPIHWGVLLVINMGLGCIVPPIALNLFISTQIAGVRYDQAVRAAVPFMVIMAVDLAIVAVFPQIALLLPHLLFNYPMP